MKIYNGYSSDIIAHMFGFNCLVHLFYMATKICKLLITFNL